MRPGQPKDKNIIENLLGVFWRWARSRIQERIFHSLADLNDFLLELAHDFNNRKQRKYWTSRRERFDAGEKEKLLALPDAAYSPGEWKTAKPLSDCHIQVGKNFYSIPHGLRDRSVDVRITASLVDVYRDLECVAKHIKCAANIVGHYITNDNHLPEIHRGNRYQDRQRT